MATRPKAMGLTQKVLLFGGPDSRMRVDRAQRSEQKTLLRSHRHPEIRKHPQVADRQVMANPFVSPRIFNNQRPTLPHDKLTEGMGERCLAGCVIRRRQTDLALEKLAPVIHKREERNLGSKQRDSNPRVTVERLFRQRVEQSQLGQCLQATGMVERLAVEGMGLHTERRLPPWLSKINF